MPSMLLTEPMLSFAERKARQDTRPATSHLVEGYSLMRDIDRPLPGDVVHRASNSPGRPDLLQQQRTNYFHDAFAVRNAASSTARERVRGDAIVLAEVKTNVIIDDEFTFLTELSYHLSTRYQRPVSSIVVTIQHGACMLFGGSFDPAYLMTIHALPSQLQPATNRRNAALVQQHMKEALGVSPARGLLRFVPSAEEQVARNGKTMAWEIDELEKSYSSGGGGGGLGGSSHGGCSSVISTSDDTASITSRRSKASKARAKLTVKSLTNFKTISTMNVPATELTPPASAGEATFTSTITAGSGQGSPERSGKTARRKKSFVASIFGRATQGAKGGETSLPAIPAEAA